MKTTDFLSYVSGYRRKVLFYSEFENKSNDK